MNYRNDKYGNPLSVLGLGCMRFPRRQGRIDMEKTEALIRAAVEAGINYFDTAYIYPGSEALCICQHGGYPAEGLDEGRPLLRHDGTGQYIHR